MLRTRATRRRLGQNFLVDRTAVRRILELLDVRPDEPVLEIGPGRGALTEGLISAAGRVAAVELDERLAEVLERRYDASELVLLRGDVLHTTLEDVAVALNRSPDTQFVVAGNLPYGISKPVVQKLIRERRGIARAVLMFQREVALRLTARPGSRDYGPLGVLAGELFQIERCFDLAPAAFRPRPKVRSSVTLWRPRPAPAIGNEERLRVCLAACFARRRRTLRNNLVRALGSERAASELLLATGVDGSLRAEAVPPEGFRRLADSWPGELV
jgi:16S rRNA (adenine1518-N6/adenine1519-N6)-dimethyltransferase